MNNRRPALSSSLRGVPVRSHRSARLRRLSWVSARRIHRPDPLAQSTGQQAASVRPIVLSLRTRLLPLLIAALPLPLGAQSVRGVLVEEGSGRTVPGAMVLLVDGTGAMVHTSLTDGGGHFVLAAPAPGTYTLRADRIGYEGITSPALELGAGQTLEYRMELPLQAITLEGITVAAPERRCVVRPGATGAETARVWAEARKALAAAAWTQRERIFRFDGVISTRRLDPRRDRVLEETVRPITGTYAQPFVSLSAEDLAAHGYVREVDGGRFYDFFAPSAEVLLSDPFLDHHCLRLAAGKNETSGLVGLAFEPVRGRSVPEIEGTFWLDAKSAELRFLEFRYTGLDARVPGEGAGGRVEFESLPNGAWIIRRWVIRTPLMEQARIASRSASRPRARVVAIREEGGEIMRTYTAAGQPIDVAVRADLAGVVHDSTAGAPLAGAEVRLTGTTYGATADTEGRFRLTGIPAGTYGVEFSHPRLDSLPIAALPPMEMTLEGGREAAVEIGVPSVARILAAACPAPDDGTPALGTLTGEATGVVVGVVRDPRTGTPAPNVPVTFSWSRSSLDSAGDAMRGGPTVVARRSWTVGAVTNASGRYWVCDLPGDTPIQASATLTDGRTLEATFRVTAEIQVLALAPPSLARAERRAGPDDGLRGSEFRILGTLARAGLEGGSALSGRLLDATTRQAIVGAAVLIDGQAAETAGAEGAFRFRRLDAGRHTIEVQHVAYGRWQETLELEGDSELQILVSLPPRPVALDAIVVSARSRGGTEAMASGSARRIVTGTELADARSRGSSVQDVIRRFPGLSVQEGTFSTNDGVVSGVCIESNRRLARLMSPRRGSAGAPRCEAVPVVVDGVVVWSSVEFLRGLRLDDFESVEFLGAMDAAIRYGEDAASAGGALVLRTRTGRR